MTKEERDAWRERLAAERLELLEDIERRELAHLELPPPRRPPSEVVFKDRQDTVVSVDRSAGEPPLFSEEAIDVIAEVLAQTRIELRGQTDLAIAPLRERIAALEGQLSMLMTMLGNGGNAAKAVARKRALPPPPDDSDARN